MELLAFGHAGPPMIVFQLDGRVLRVRRPRHDRALADKLEHGQLRLFLRVVGRQRELVLQEDSPAHRVERHLHYEDYVLNEAVPLIKHLTRQDAIGVTGCSFGAYHAMALALRNPVHLHVVRDDGRRVRRVAVLDGYFDEDCYFLNPPSFLPGLADPYYLDQFRRNKWVLVTGDHDICRAPNEQSRRCCTPRASPQPARLERLKHDWPYWRPMAAAYLPVI
jgi:esterase/lipase superfamily enzyme